MSGAPIHDGGSGAGPAGGAGALPFEGKSALVTGGAHRVGKAIALELSRRGARVAIHFNGAVEAAEETVRQLSAAGRPARWFQRDLTQPDAPHALIDEVLESFGELDLLVNSAAVMRRTPVDEITVAEWDAIFALNLRAPFFLAQAAHPWLRRTCGAIVNIADLAAFETWPAYVPHGISKAAIVQMTRALARVFAPEVRVNAVAPGAVLLPDSWDQDSAEHLVRTTPLGRLGTPEDVAQAVCFLAAADYVTGETLIVDGGRHIRT